MSPEDNQIPVLYSIYTAADEDATARLIGEVFAHRDPPAVAAGITPEEFEAFVRLFLPKAGPEGLTVLARFEDNGELAGVMLNEDCASDLPEGMYDLPASFGPVGDILGGLAGEYHEKNHFGPGEGVHLFLLAVADRGLGMGIGQELVAASLRHAADKGYRKAVVECTNKTSQHIFRKFGFTDRIARSYAEHRFEGKAWFESIAEHGGPILMDRDLP